MRQRDLDTHDVTSHSLYLVNLSHCLALSLTPCLCPLLSFTQSVALLFSIFHSPTICVCCLSVCLYDCPPLFLSPSLACTYEHTQKCIHNYLTTYNDSYIAVIYWKSICVYRDAKINIMESAVSVSRRQHLMISLIIRVVHV